MEAGRRMAGCVRPRRDAAGRGSAPPSCSGQDWASLDPARLGKEGHGMSAARHGQAPGKSCLSRAWRGFPIPAAQAPTGPALAGHFRSPLGRARSTSACHGFPMACLGGAGSTRHGPSRQVAVWRGQAKQGFPRCGLAGCGWARQVAVRQYATRPGVTRHGSTRRGPAWWGLARLDSARRAFPRSRQLYSRRGPARLGSAWPYRSRRGSGSTPHGPARLPMPAHGVTGIGRAGL